MQLGNHVLCSSEYQNVLQTTNRLCINGPCVRDYSMWLSASLWGTNVCYGVSNAAQCVTNYLAYLPEEWRERWTERDLHFSSSLLLLILSASLSGKVQTMLECLPEGPLANQMWTWGPCYATGQWKLAVWHHRDGEVLLKRKQRVSVCT